MFFIFDCNDCIVGNPKGYTKYYLAQRQATKMRNQLWARYDDKVLKYKQDGIPPIKWDRTIYTISE